MGGKQRIYKQRIALMQTLAKISRAMEMITVSRVGGAHRVVTALRPYEKALTQAVAAVAVHMDLDHPLTCERFDTPRVAVLVIASDRGMTGAYSATILREPERLISKLKSEGKVPVVYIFGKRARSCFCSYSVAVEKSWEGESDAPTRETTRSILNELFERFMDQGLAPGVSEVHLVYTRLATAMKQFPEVRQMLPLSIVDIPEGDAECDTGRGYHDDPSATLPEHEFIPSAQAVPDAILPLYIESRIHNTLLQSTASELISCQHAMYMATDNAEELIAKYARLASSVRQADTTQETNEVVGGVDVLVAS